jgi:hypothetical protein
MSQPVHPLHAQAFHGRAVAAAFKSFDGARMSAKMIISTPGLDHECEVVDPMGIELAYYQHNPVVFFGHQMWPLPIGVSRSPSGELCVWKSPLEVEAECFFSAVNPDAELVARLVEEKTISATSIGFVPLETIRLSDEESKKLGARFAVYKHVRVDLTEWSFVGVGMNPEATARAVANRRVGAVRVSDHMLKALEPFAAELTTFATGGMFPPPPPQLPPTETEAVEPGASEMSQTNGTAPTAPVLPPVPPAAPPSPPEPPPPAEKAKAKKGDDGGDEQPPLPGVVALQTLYTLTAACAAKADELRRLNELPQILEIIDAFKASCGTTLSDIAGKAAEMYPDAKFEMDAHGAGEDEDDESDEEDDDSEDDDDKSEDEDEDEDGEDMKAAIDAVNKGIAELLKVIG